MSVAVVLLCVILGLLTLILYKIHRRLNYWQSRGIACENPSFSQGSLRGVIKERSFAECFNSYYKKFKGTGPFVGFYWFQQPSMLLLETSLIKHVLIKDFSKFTNRGLFCNEKDDPLTGHLLALDGQRWRTMRSKLAPAFSSAKMKFMLPTVLNVTRELVRVFDEMSAQNAAIEVKDLTTRFTLDVIGTCVFGIECNSLKDPQEEFRIMSGRALKDKRHGRLGMIFISSFPELARRLHMKQTPEHIEKFFMRIVRETVATREQHSIKKNDLMDILIGLKNSKSLKSESGDHLTNLTIEEIAGQGFIFLFAGFETTAVTMAFALYELAQHVEIQQKAREEVQQVLAANNGELTYECIREMAYLDQVIAETLRLYSPVPMLNRKCVQECVIPGSTPIVVPKGMNIFIPIQGIHRDAAYYPNPDDFNPENFSPEKVRERDSVEYLPFGDGPRNCVGMRFGQMQMRIGLALLLKHFKFSVCEETQIPLKFAKRSFLLNSESGIYLKVEKV